MAEHGKLSSEVPQVSVRRALRGWHGGGSREQGVQTDGCGTWNRVLTGEGGYCAEARVEIQRRRSIGFGTNRKRVSGLPHAYTGEGTLPHKNHNHIAVCAHWQRITLYRAHTKKATVEAAERRRERERRQKKQASKQAGRRTYATIEAVSRGEGGACRGFARAPQGRFSHGHGGPVGNEGEVRQRGGRRELQYLHCYEQH